ncbi:MAG: aldo/keto reductase [Myxococcales bacterium]|nr:aldo/keto reductase [Myxococcales bacterium]
MSTQTSEQRRLGSSDLSVSTVTLGAWALGGSMWGGQDEKHAIAAIDASLAAGVTCIDTAPIYGMGHSETLVGQALRQLRTPRQQVVIATKCGLAWDSRVGTFKFDLTDVDGSVHPVFHDLRPERVRQECEDSLRRLQVDYIDLYQVHWPEPAKPVTAALETLAQLRNEGKIRWIGVSNFSVAQLEEASKVAPVVSVQPPYNLLERGLEAALLPWCREHAVGVIAYSPIARGLLSGKYKPDHTFPANDHRATVRWFQPEVRHKVDAALAQARDMAHAHSCTLANLAAAWVIGQAGVTSAIVGARNAEQARENARAMSVKLSQEDKDALSRTFAGI